MLPIHAIEEEVLRELSLGNRLVITAPTGSGKTTQAPKFLLRCPAIRGQVVVLQPRRLAARMVAERVAKEMGSPIGQLVGYQTRHDSRISASTVIRFMTEGLFLRIMQGDPRLEGIGAVVFDEFHERNLATDTAIALVKMLQETSRPDLRMVVMSATLDVRRVGQYLAAPALEAHGRAYPVNISYLAGRSTAGRKTTALWENRQATPPWEMAASALEGILREQREGDVLVFMPGGYEIRRTIELCERIDLEPLSIFPLYSELTPREQDAAVSPAPHRKVIVATNVAETSITIEGIRHVIDSGLARINRFDPRRGLNMLMVEPISQASADQRAGRAGRTAPGSCVRLWPQAEHRHRPAYSTPEIQRLDLAEVILQLLALGVRDVRAFPWLEAPEALPVEQALRTLEGLGAVADGRMTELGEMMAGMPMHPRLSRMLVEAAGRGALERGALWAALISDRDILVRGVRNEFAEGTAEGFPRSDLVVLEQALAFARAVQFDAGRCAARGVHASACREVEKTRQLYLNASRDARLPRKRQQGEGEVGALAKALLVAFPDHVARRRGEVNLACALVGGRRGQLDSETVAKGTELVLPIEVREVGAGAGKDAVKTVLSMATELDPAWLREVHPGRVVVEEITEFNPQTQAVESIQRERFEDLVIAEEPGRAVDAAKAETILAGEVAAGRLKLEGWDESVEQWMARVRCVAEWFPERGMIGYDEEDRQLIIEEICARATRYKQVRDKPCLPFVKGVLTWEEQQLVERMAPDRIALPRGWKMRIDYTPGAPPRGRAKIQDFFGLSETPTVAGGRVKVLLEILAPSMRPVQLTDDLGNFWKNLYPTLRKELSRKYPRHEWQ